MSDTGVSGHLVKLRVVFFSLKTIADEYSGSLDGDTNIGDSDMLRQHLSF